MSFYEQQRTAISIYDRGGIELPTHTSNRSNAPKLRFADAELVALAKVTRCRYAER
jgi:hypothetical protein